ncbi:hypothetical protein PROFUN_03050 [Planoprotostelium fungivorum]|uniref:Uncharacterized protein n=1 Tax=Planoprotostelium fungivorum TaxID=1890364 RepID=A0A2P6NQ40_9EUKA|nr:hypothetical protein PROFUN_03050 [Planoprotostelium fungivorum]
MEWKGSRFQSSRDEAEYYLKRSVWLPGQAALIAGVSSLLWSSAQIFGKSEPLLKKKRFSAPGSTVSSFEAHRHANVENATTCGLIAATWSMGDALFKMRFPETPLTDALAASAITSLVQTLRTGSTGSGIVAFVLLSAINIGNELLFEPYNQMRKDRLLARANEPDTEDLPLLRR